MKLLHYRPNYIIKIANMDNEWLSFCEKFYREPPTVPYMSNYIQIYKDDYRIQILDPFVCAKIPYGTVELVIINGNPLMCDTYDADILFNNLPTSLKVLQITNLVNVLTNLPISLEKVIIHNYTEEAKEMSRFPFGCDIEYKGFFITKKPRLNYDSD